MDQNRRNQINSGIMPIPVAEQDPMDSNPNFGVDPSVDLQEPKLSDINIDDEIDMAAKDMDVSLDVPAETPANEPMIPEGLNRQQILDAYRRLKPAQENYQNDLRNIAMMQGMNQISQGIARGYGANIGDGSEGLNAMRAASKEGVDAIGRELDTAKNTMGTSKMLMDYEESEKMNDPTSDISKLYRERAYNLLSAEEKRTGRKSELLGKLENMSASQLSKLGIKLMGDTGPTKNQRTDLLSTVVTDKYGSFRRNLEYDPINGNFYRTPEGIVPYTGPTTRQVGYMDPKTGLRQYFEEGTQPPGWVRESDRYQGITSPQTGVSTSTGQPGSAPTVKEPIKIDYNMLSNVDVKTRDRLLGERENIQKLTTSSLEDAKQLSNLKEVTEKGVADNQDLVGYVMNNVARTLNGEKGTMTEGDLARARPRQDWLGALDEWKENKLFNRLTQKSKDIILDAIRMNKDIANKNLTSVMNIRSRPAVRDLESILGRSVDPRSVEDFMGITDALDEYRKFNKIGEKTSNSKGGIPVAPEGHVTMKKPDGKFIFIPKENVEAGKKRGLVEVK